MLACQVNNYQSFHNFNDSSTQHTNVLSQDEISNILEYLPIGNKLMLSCTCKGLFQMINTLVHQQFPGYEDSVPLVQIWLKYNEYRVTSLEDFDSLRTRLERAGSFSGVTQKLVMHFANNFSDEKFYPELKSALDILSIPTGRTIAVQVIENAKSTTMTTKLIPELMGHTLKHCLIDMNCFSFKLLNLICSVESLEFVISKFEVIPEYYDTVVLSNLKRITDNCELPISFHQYLSRLVPNLEILDLSQMCGKFPRCYIDNCSNIQVIRTNNEDQCIDVSDEDLLYMVEHLPKLRRLDISSGTITGSAFEQLGKYASSLEFLRIDGQRVYSTRWNTEATINGGKLPALKIFSFNGVLFLDDEGGYDIVSLFRSVIRNCPNINHISIWDQYVGYYPSNLYGLVPIENVTELLLCSSNKKPQLFSNKSRAIDLYPIPGVNALDTIINMNQNWKEIAQSNFVRVVTVYEIPSMEVLQRCKWINAQTLILASWSEAADNLEWFKCLANSCPNIRHLKFDSNELPPRLLQILCDSNDIWPDLIDCSIDIPDELVDTIATVRPEFQKRQRKEPIWESQWK
jgi:hypothetical protein